MKTKTKENHITNSYFTNKTQTKIDLINETFTMKIKIIMKIEVSNNKHENFQ